MDTLDFDRLLDAYHASALFEMAEAAGLQTTGTGRKLRKVELIALLKPHLFSRKRVLAAWENLIPRDRAVLERLLVRGGRQPVRLFKHELLRDGLIADQPSQKTGRRAHGEPPTPASFDEVMARLTRNGLVFSGDRRVLEDGYASKLRLYPAGSVFVPDEIRRHLPEPAPLAPAATTFQPAEIRAGDPDSLLRDLYLYWDTVRRRPVNLIRSGRVGKRSLKVLNQVLLQPDPDFDRVKGEDQTPYLYRLRQLLQALGLIERTLSGDLVVAGADSVDIPDFWSWLLAEQAGACLEVWPSLNGLSEVDSQLERYSPRVTKARQTLLAVLQSLPAGVWVELEEIVLRVQAQDPNFLFGDRARLQAYSGSWYYSNSYFYGRPEELSRIFEKGERDFIRACLAGFLLQVGYVDLGFKDHQLAYVLVQSHLSDQPPAGSLIVQPTFQVMALGPVSLATLAKLDLFADRERVDRTTFEYRLSRESLYRAQKLGMEVDQVIALLTEASQVPVPQNVLRSLEEWRAQQERIVFRTGATLIQAADGVLLAALLDAPHVGPHLERAVTADVALVRSEGVQPLVAALLKEGILPAVSGPHPESADGSVLIAGDATIRTVHEVPNLYLRGRLARFAEKLATGGWRLTPDSVRLAGGNKARVQRILQELEKLSREPLPNGLADKIRAWGGYYGDAAIETVVLLEFRDREALDELRAEPALRELLLPFSAGNRALAVVPAGRVDELREQLAGYGVRLVPGFGRQ